MINWYIEENGLPKKVDMKTWSKWVESNPNRVVKRTELEKDKIEVITVFFPLPEIDLEFDHESGEPPKEILYFYGTLVRGSPMGGHEEKYRLREQAEDSHEKIVSQVKALLEGKGEVPECCR